MRYVTQQILCSFVYFFVQTSQVIPLKDNPHKNKKREEEEKRATREQEVVMTQTERNAAASGGHSSYEYPLSFPCRRRMLLHASVFSLIVLEIINMLEGISLICPSLIPSFNIIINSSYAAKTNTLLDWRSG